MTMKPERWVALVNRAPLRMPGPGDVLGVIVATDRAQARRTAERLYRGRDVIVVNSRSWPVDDATPICYEEPAV